MQRKEYKVIKASKAFKGTAQTDGFEFQVSGDQAPFINLVMKPGKEMIVEPGTMMTMGMDVSMRPILGDGREQGVGSKLWNAFKRAVSGENIVMSAFKNEAKNEQLLQLAVPHPGEIMPVNLNDHGGMLICQQGAFMAAPKGVTIDIHFKKKLGVGLFGGQGFIMQKLMGQDWVFLNAGGNLSVHDLQEGEKLKIDTGSLVAATSAVDMDFEMVKGVGSMLFGGEGLFHCTATGPGRVWVQSMPWSRQVQIIRKAVGSNTGDGTKGLDIGSLVSRNFDP
jgi:uncharacterized protein (TIGR00266 family)